MFRYSLVVLLGLCTTGPALGASWADALFEEVSKDFGSAPRGPVLTHSFRIVNKTGSPVTIHNTRASCGCVTAFAVKLNLQPGEETTLQVRMDTTRFNGAKVVTIYVQFSQPSWDEVRLSVQANSRDDVTVAPDTLAFGHVKRGSVPVATTAITFVGNSSAQVLDARCESNYVQTSLRELRRTNGEVSYQLTAQLRADAPPGKWYTDIWLRTNSPVLPRVRVPLTVEIGSALSVNPASVALGPVKPGAVVERKVIVRGTQPFRIVAVHGTDQELTVKDSTEEAKPVHVLTITFRPAHAGELDRILRLITDLKEDGQIEFQARAQVVP